MQQHEDDTQALPVRLYGRFAAKYRDLVEPGQPLKVVGELRVRVKPVAAPETDADGNVVAAGRGREVPVHPLCPPQGNDPGRGVDQEHAAVGAGTHPPCDRAAHRQRSQAPASGA